MAQALESILENLAAVLGGLDQTVYTVSAVIGVAFVGRALFLMKHGERTGIALTTLALGVMLFSLKSLISAASLSLFEEEAGLLSQLAGIRNQGLLSPYIHFAVTIVVLVGILSILRGILKLHASATGHGESFWQGLTHLFAGILCVNIVTFARLFGQSAGGVVAELIEALF
ncbi:MAG: hypothetical protein K5657_06580 [Desulfovibrio sp.]|nr:hypothetical protein [Desulfovibrio sp.]